MTAIPILQIRRAEGEDWCVAATWPDGHHLIWFIHGGPTTVDNGALPCPAHHTSATKAAGP